MKENKFWIKLLFLVFYSFLRHFPFSVRVLYMNAWLFLLETKHKILTYRTGAFSYKLWKVIWLYKLILFNLWCQQLILGITEFLNLTQAYFSFVEMPMCNKLGVCNPQPMGNIALPLIPPMITSSGEQPLIFFVCHLFPKILTSLSISSLLVTANHFADMKFQS